MLVLGVSFLIVLAMCFLLRPLRRYGGGARVASKVTLLLTICSVSLYWGLGNASGLFEREKLMAVTDFYQGILLALDIGKLPLSDVESQLSLRLQKNPGEVQGWYILGQLSAAKGEWINSAQFFKKAQLLAPEDKHIAAALSVAEKALVSENNDLKAERG